MGKLLKEAALDDRFNAQMNKVEGAINSLRDIILQMQSPDSMTKLTSSQRMQLKHATEDLKRLFEAA